MRRQKPKVLGKSSSNCKGSLYTFVPTKTRRGKDAYKEEDARKLYSTQSGSSTPTTSGTSVTQNVTFSNDLSEACNLPTSDWMDEQPAYRHTKVYKHLYSGQCQLKKLIRPKMTLSENGSLGEQSILI